MKTRIFTFFSLLALCLLVTAGTAFAQEPAGVAYDTLAASAKTDMVAALTKIIPAVLGVMVTVQGCKVLVRWLKARFN